MFKNFLRVTTITLLMALIFSGFAYYQLERFLDSPLSIPDEGMEYALLKGGSLNSMTHSLAADGVLDNPRWLTAYSRLARRGSVVIAGDYWLEPGLTPRQLLLKLERGDVRYFQVTLVEGWNLTQVRAALEAQPRLKQLLKVDVMLDSDLLGVELIPSLEGMLFPDTYRFHSGSSDIELLQQSYSRMQDVLGREWLQRESGLPYKNAYEALIMASLIEKETGVASERAEIAGVFVRRLQKNMRLQTDPTIIYGLGSAFDGNLRSRHLKDASNPYNTYRHHGLTPTPIALAGAEAIHAALHPAKGKALYFVAKGDGSHYFSETLSEHRKAVRKYQIDQRRKNYSSAPQKN
jgi:UPF0755 protein